MNADPVSRAVLLDTCAVIWVAEGSRLSAQARRAITAAGLEGRIYVSPISAWEVGLLARPRRERPSMTFLPDPKTWFANLMAGPGISTAGLTPEIAIDSSLLPGTLHGDPADRLLIATARRLAVPIVTRDERIAKYAEQGHVEICLC